MIMIVVMIKRTIPLLIIVVAVARESLFYVIDTYWGLSFGTPAGRACARLGGRGRRGPQHAPCRAPPEAVPRPAAPAPVGDLRVVLQHPGPALVHAQPAAGVPRPPRRAAGRHEGARAVR
eukprot:scaffold372618_cov23-Prasinocladus_malaysianus.AAC.1